MRFSKTNLFNILTTVPHLVLSPAALRICSLFVWFCPVDPPGRISVHLTFRRCFPHRDTLDVLKLDVAQRDQAVVFAVLLRQLQGLGGFTPLGVVEVHRPRKVDEDLQGLRGPG